MIKDQNCLMQVEGSLDKKDPRRREYKICIKKYDIIPSIHHLPLLRGSGRGGSSLSKEAQTSLSPATSSSSSGGTPRRSQASRET